MITEAQINRINELARKAKTPEGLTPEETAVLDALRLCRDPAAAAGAVAALLRLCR